jgi:hypothetical protein
VLVGLGDGFFYPAFGGLVPLVVEPASISSANALIGVARWGSLMLGPALAAGVYGAAGSATVFAVDAASFLVSASLLYPARPRVLEAAAAEGTLREILAGVRYVARIPWLWVTITVFAVVLMLQLAPLQVLLPKLVAQHFHRGVAAYGLLTAVFGLGTVGGALAFGQFHPRRRRGVVSYCIWAVNSATVVVFALSPWYELAVALSLMRGFLVGYGVAIWETMLMELVPEHLLSRVVSLDYFGSYGLMPAGLALSAGVAGLAPAGTIMAAGAAASIGLILAVLTRPWLWEVQ